MKKKAKTPKAEEIRKGKVSEIPSERLKKCFEAGNVFALFKVLGDWPLEELKAAEEDLQVFHEAVTNGLDAVANRFAKMYDMRGKALKAHKAFIAKEKERNLFKATVACAEIMSVIVYYIIERKAGR
jgi:ABC-type uncharacterized transport system auxiliary subunit